MRRLIAAFTLLTGSALAQQTFRPNLPGIRGQAVDAKLTERLSVRDFGASCNNSSDDSASFLVAQTALAAGGTLEVRGGICVIGTDLTTPSTVSLDFDGGASVSVAGGKTLVLGAAPQAGPHRIFYGAGLVKFGKNVPLEKILPEWFGAVADYDWVRNSGTDNNPAIQRMLSTLLNVGGGVASATWSGGNATFTTRGLHLMQTGDRLMISGVAPSGYNQPSCLVTVTGTKTFSCAVVSNPGNYRAGGRLRDVRLGEVRSGGPPIPPIYFGTGSYMITGGLGDDLVDAQYIMLTGASWSSSYLVCKPLAAATNCLPFTSSNGAYLRFGNGIRNLSIISASVNVNNLVSYSVQHELVIEHAKLGTWTSGLASGKILSLAGMQSSRVGPDVHMSGGRADVFVIEPSPTSTTVSIDNVNIEGALGSAACMNLGGSSSAAGISVTGSTVVENCGWGIIASTEVNLDGVHYEGNRLGQLWAKSGSTVKSIHANYQWCSYYKKGRIKGGTAVKLDAGAIAYDTNARNDLDAGCSLYDTATGSHLYTSGPNLPEATFPEGVFNAGDPNAATSGMLRKTCFRFAGVAGAISFQPFRGHCYDMELAGNTTVSFPQALTGIPPGEEFTLFLTTNGSSFRLTQAGVHDLPLKGSFNDSGRAANTYQVLTLRVDTSQHIVVVSSPGWRPITSSAGYPEGDFSGVSTSAPLGGTLRWRSAKWQLWMGQCGDVSNVTMGVGGTCKDSFAYFGGDLVRFHNTAAGGSTSLQVIAGRGQGDKPLADFRDRFGGSLFKVDSSGVYIGGSAIPFPSGLTVTKTVRDAAGTGTCTLIFTNGLLTGGTC